MTLKMQTVVVGLALGIAAASADAQLRFNLLRQINVSGAGIGNGPASVAWNGTDLYVGGLNNTGSAASVGIARVSNALGALAISSPFGVSTSSAFSGYEYLDINGNQVLGSFTDSAVNAIRSFDGAAGTQQWSLSQAPANGVEGVTYDRRFGGRVAHLQFGRGFAFLDNPDGTARADIGIFSGAVGTAWRGAEIGFNGDLLVRAANGVYRYATGDGTPASGTWNATSPVRLGNGATSQGLNIEAIDNTGFGEFAIWNNRLAGGGSLLSSLTVTDFAGNVQAITLNLNGQTIANSLTQWYDFSYDRGTNTLAVSDLTNGRVYIFGIVPSPASSALLAVGGIMAARRRRG